ncbi:MAG: nucleotidyltransferase domain-containing protein [Pseudomonadota bacterium]
MVAEEQHQVTEYQFFKKLCALPFVEKMYLYGSRARGDYHSRSDIDLAIVCPSASREEWTVIFEIVEDADTLLHIDCVRYDGLTDNNPLKQSIDEDRLVLYQR